MLHLTRMSFGYRMLQTISTEYTAAHPYQEAVWVGLSSPSLLKLFGSRLPLWANLFVNFPFRLLLRHIRRGKTMFRVARDNFWKGVAAARQQQGKQDFTEHNNEQ
jgi:hypothetical protein